MKDCDFCRNAYTCDDLDHDNDLASLPCGLTLGQGVRMMFTSGDNRRTELTVEHQGRYGWQIIARLDPDYCPFCGRLLFENIVKRRQHR